MLAMTTLNERAPIDMADARKTSRRRYADSPIVEIWAAINHLGQTQAKAIVSQFASDDMAIAQRLCNWAKAWREDLTQIGATKADVHVDIVALQL